MGVAAAEVVAVVTHTVAVVVTMAAVAAAETSLVWGVAVGVPVVKLTDVGPAVAAT